MSKKIFALLLAAFMMLFMASALAANTEETPALCTCGKDVQVPERVSAKPATCKDDGYEAYTKCTKCKLPIGTPIVVLKKEDVAHTPVAVAAVPATCASKGKTAGTDCSVCGIHIVPQEDTEKDPTAHNVEIIPGKKATCTATGLTEGKKCTNNGCPLTKDGKAIIIEQQTISALGHEWIAVEAKAATCKEPGRTAGEKCERCEADNPEKESTEIPASTHTWEYKEAVAAECGKAGNEAYFICSVCQEMRKSDGTTVITKVPETTALEHVWKETTKGVAATCTKAGKTAVETCEKCSDVRGGETIPAAGHKLIHNTAVSGDCVTLGSTEGDTCSVCDYTTVEKKYGSHPTVASNWVNGVCQKCQKACDHKDTGRVEYGKLDATTGVVRCACKLCGEFMDNHNWDAAKGVCKDCKYDHTVMHNPSNKWDASGKCETCKFQCTHEKIDATTGKCETCGKLECKHEWNVNGVCTKCLLVCKHEKYENGNCKVCGVACKHDKSTNEDDNWENGKCVKCGKAHDHKDSKWDENPGTDNGVWQCTICEYVCKHETFKDQKCTVCGKECTNHKMEVVEVVVKGSCDTYYIHNLKCKNCGLTATDKYLGHDFKKLHVAATCTKPADYDWYCVNCNTKATAADRDHLGLAAVPAEDKPTDATLKPHTFVYENRDNNGTWVYEAATCTKAGKAWAYCSVCTGKELNGYKPQITEIPALGHKTERKHLDANCTQDERNADVCSRCYAEINVEIVPNGQKAPGNHNIVSHTVVNPTCVKDGVEYDVCSRCNQQVNAVTIKKDPTKNHHFVEKKVLYEGDCTSKRVVVMGCDNKDASGKVCDYAEVQVFPTYHKLVPGVNYKPATCGAPATGKMICSVCSNEFDATEPATGNHNYVDGTIKPADCKDPEMVGYYCTVCYTAKPGTTPVKTDPNGTELGHDWNIIKDRVDEYGNVIYKEAKCNKPGQGWADKCKRCGEPKNAVVEITKAHAKATYDYVEATCTKGAFYAEVCPVCKTVVGKTEYPVEGSKALGHDYEKKDVAATCKEQGYTAEVCKRCNDVQKKVITSVVNPDGHKFATVKVIRPASCTETGIDLQKCALCGGATRLNISSAAHKWNAGTISIAATCGKKGQGEHTCTVCNKTEKYDIAPTGQHNYDGKTIKPATCTEVEKYGTFCTVCGYNLNGDAVDIGTKTAGHKVEKVLDKKDESGKLIATDPTCTKPGKYYQECTVCKGEGKVVNVPALGHTWGEEQKNDLGTVTYKTCKTCGEREIISGKVDADDCITFGHTPAVVPAVAATCTKTGLTEGKVCSVCNKTLVAQEDVKALGHTEETVAGKAATCTEDGLTEGKKCSVCGETTVKQEVVKALGHKHTKKFSFNEDFTKRVVTFTCVCGDTYSTEEDF